jgi:two-component system chemotaxis sensor kinase CheA
MKLTFRFLLLVVSLLAAVGVCVLTGSRALGQLDVALQRVVDDDVERLLAITHARRVFRSMVVLERDYILTKSDKERAEMSAKMGSLSSELSQYLARYEKSMHEADRGTVNDIRGARERWLELHARVRAAAELGQEQALLASKEHAKDPVSWESAIGALIKASEARLAEQVTNTHAAIQRAQSTLIYDSLAAAALALGFGSLILRGIRRNVKTVIEVNANLEALVAARTAALTEREHALRLVLDSTGDALLGIDTEVCLNGQASAAAERWFGSPEAGLNAGKYLFAGDSQQFLGFELSFAQLKDDILPWDVAVDQLPKRISRPNQILGLEYKPITEHGKLKSVLLVARDITAQVERENTEQRSREQQTSIANLLSDKRGFEQFVRDCEQLLAGLPEQTDLTTIKRDLHTLKGNAAIFGLDSIAQCCHRIEDRMALDGALLAPHEMDELSSLWDSRLQNTKELLSKLRSNLIEVRPEDHQALIDGLLRRRDHDEILGSVEEWNWSRTSERLAHLQAQIEYLAKRLTKQVIVEVEHNDIRIPRGYLDAVWPALVHAARNAVDHGIEPAHVRQANGKPAGGKITLRTCFEADCLCIEVCDDGQGIDARALGLAAERKGLFGEASVEELVFMDGVSSREQVSDVSGRGVGLSALRQACQQAGGSAQVSASPGMGTRLTLKFPRPVVKLGAIASRGDRRWSVVPRASDALRREAMIAARG